MQNSDNTPLGAYVQARLKAPIYNSAKRTWDVQYLENKGWKVESFNTWSKAYNFYLDKWDFHQYWFETNTGRTR